MYGKLFRQMYHGTLGTVGPWQALVTFQQMIVLADQAGVVDMTPEAIARETTIPLDIIRLGITALEQPDPDSRTPDEQGRRILLLSPDRNWGWRITNYDHYRKLRREEDRKEYHRQYWHKRKLNNSTTTQPTQPIAYAEANAKVNKNAPTVLGLNPEAWEAWESYRRGIRKPLREVSIPSAMKKLAAFGDDQLAVVEQSKANGWTGLFPLPVATKRISAASVFPDARAAIHDPSLRKKFPPDSRVFKAVQLLGGWQEFGNRSPKFIEKEFCDAYERTA